MRRILIELGLTCALAAAAMVAHAQETSLLERMTLSSYAGTLGPGVELGLRFDDNWRARAGINGFQADYVYHQKKSDLHSRLTLLNAGLTADYYPFAGDFHVSAGVRLSANKVEGRMKNLRARVKGGATIEVPDPLTTYRVEQNAIQPYIGAGYSVKVDERVSLNFDLGALYAGTPDLAVNSRAYIFGVSRNQIRNEIERARDRISPFKIYPVVQVGLTFSF
ncbi:hypothetical protein JJB09_04395 [Rhizobium sp. KVB221]|uniref:Outer membrane protein beta-barrel domain-containing protein n=1 Tax=Rhizobium setariae TaxID=2801340 RepID=A0A936YN14_9HYPH|nr:hypothetical protein [Rhizobium setariae]MBL0371261.1 hypothetical protein [Rhizobium setariae]